MVIFEEVFIMNDDISDKDEIKQIEEFNLALSIANDYLDRLIIKNSYILFKNMESLLVKTLQILSDKFDFIRGGYVIKVFDLNFIIDIKNGIYNKNDFIFEINSVKSKDYSIEYYNCKQTLCSIIIYKLLLNNDKESIVSLIIAEFMPNFKLKL